MDPITGIGLAASVIQLLTFSIDAVKTCREVYQKGSVSDYSNLDYTTGHLAGLTSSLQNSVQSSRTTSRALTREEKDLVDLARECEDCAKKLQKELNKLQTQSRASTLEAVRIAVRAIRKKSTIDKINQHLQAYQSTLETSLLSRLSQRFDTQGLQNDKSFANLDKSLQHIITCLANAQTSLIGLVVQESAQTRHYITAQIDRVERLHKDDRRYEEIVNSLFYPDISSRQEQVDGQFDGIKNSYDWIFDDPQTHGLGSYDGNLNRQQERQWDDFARWLKSGHGVYWINGKAGSGKSTLMNHICNHSRRLELLGEWCSHRRLLTPTFFFWNAGTRLQKSIDGLLRSLVYQMLKECRELVGCFSNEPLHTWTQSRLLATLLNLLKQSQVPIAICMFIDGLDEFEGHEDTVIKMIGDLADQTHVKVCVTSRPLLAFEEAFSKKPSLRLQDLTFDSIRAYTEHKLSEPIQKYVSFSMCKPDQAEALVDKIVERAHGVFLWAFIASREVHDSLQGMANINTLAQTLETLPSEIESLFMLMLHRIKRAFKRDAAYFLGFAMYENSISDCRVDLFTLYFSHSQRELKDRPVCYENISSSQLVVACRTMGKRLLSHTAGLLELTPKEKGGRLYENWVDHDPVMFTDINFIHRTARDFLLMNDGAKSFLATYGCSEAQVRLSIARGTLAHVAYFSQMAGGGVALLGLNPVYTLFYTALQQISKAEQILGEAQTNLMQSLNYESLARECHIPDIEMYGPITPQAFMINGRCKTSIDQVGMAAYVGMTRHVCEQLDLPTKPRNYRSNFPDLKNYSRSKENTALLAWTSGCNDSPNQNIHFTTELRSSKYRQALGRYLQWKLDDQVNSQTQVPPQKNLLAESYMLCCCGRKCLDLARVLLRAGANPMVQVRAINWFMKSGRGFDKTGPFWDRWLWYLIDLHLNNLKATREFQGLKLNDQDLEENITLEDVFDTTKALVANGADINYRLKELCSGHYCNLLKRPDLDCESFSFSLTASAMFILTQCFNSEPEFRHFASEIDPLVKKPTRELEALDHSSLFYTIRESNHTKTKVRPSAEESEMLWPLIEKWEDTGCQDDKDELEAAFHSVWRAHNPGVELRRRMRWSLSSSDDESTPSEDVGVEVDDDDDENDDEHDDDEHENDDEHDDDELYSSD